MQSRVYLSLVLAFTANMVMAATEFDCKNVGGQAGPFIVDEITISQTTKAEFELNFSSNRGPLGYMDVHCVEEFSPDRILACEHDLFSLIISLEESPYQAALYPFIFENTEYGPFYFLCESKKN